MTILDELAEYARERVACAKEKQSLEEIKALAEKMPRSNFEFEKAINKSEIALICECKKASPSKGIIAKEFPYLKIAKEYEMAGVNAISVLTEPKWFLGSDVYLKEIAQAIRLPCLRKDFIVDEYMIYEAKLLGAAAVLLICAILSQQELKKYIQICDELGISALVEVHDEEEVARAIEAGARIIGVNNRNLKDFSVDMNTSKRLRELVPKEILFVAESGIKTAAEIQILQKLGVNAVLIGETMMKAKDKGEMLQQLRNCV